MATTNALFVLIGQPATRLSLKAPGGFEWRGQSGGVLQLPSTICQPGKHTRSQPLSMIPGCSARLCILGGARTLPAVRMVLLSRIGARLGQQTTAGTRLCLAGAWVSGPRRQLAPTGPRRLGLDPTLRIAGQEHHRPYPRAVQAQDGASMRANSFW